MSKDIRTEKLSVGYGKKCVIEGIELSAEAGDIISLIGPNGCGKTTVLRPILTQLQALEGCIYVAGKDMDDLSGDDIAHFMSMVTTKRPVTELMTCREVIATGRYPYTGRFGLLNEKDEEKVQEAIDFMHVESIAEEDFSKISDGQKQRVMLARAICQEPEILILDEPTSFLDIRYKLDILNGIYRLSREKKVTVIMSLHELDIARAISDRLVCIEKVRIGRVGKPDEIYKDGYLAKIYGIDPDCLDEKTGTIILKEHK